MWYVRLGLGILRKARPFALVRKIQVAGARSTRVNLDPASAHGGADMASGRLFLAATLSLATSAVLPTVVFAQAAPSQEAAPPTEAGSHQGRVTANGVYVRSRASDDAYPTM